MKSPTGPIPVDQLLAYFEGALSPDATRDLIERLKDDADAQAILAEWERQNAAIGTLFDPVAEEPVPTRLTAIVRSARQPAASPSPPIFRIAAMLGLLAIGATGGWFAAGMRVQAPHDVAQAAIGAHLTYVVEVLHPVEVKASEAAHLTGWISKRLGTDISAPDFAANGFHLMGGRVLPGDTGAAALFMYENDAGQRVTLYVAPQSRNIQTAFQFAQSGGVHSFYWMDGTLNYAVVGDIPREALRAIALEAYDQLI